MRSEAYIGIIVGIAVFIVLKSTCILYLWRRRYGKDKSKVLNSAHSTASVIDSKALLAYIDKWEICCDDVKILKRPDGSDWELGSGSFGRVVKGVRAGVQDVAIKMLYQSDQKAQEAFLREISMLKFASCDRNVVQFYGVSVKQNGIWLITEHMEGGDLRNALALEGKDKVTWWTKGKQIACDIARGLAFLHSKKIIHLYKDDNEKAAAGLQAGEAKITDVGMARLMSDAYFLQDMCFGTFSWAAPEVLLGKRCSEKVDCYSLGVTCWEIATGLMPVRGRMAPASKDECPIELMQLVKDLMARDPHVRPSAAASYRRLMALKPNPQIVAWTEHLQSGSSLQSSQAKKLAADADTSSDSNSSSTPNLQSEDSQLLKLARRASEDIDMLENSYAGIAAGKKGDVAEKEAAQESAALMRLANDASYKLDIAIGIIEPPMSQETSIRACAEPDSKTEFTLDIAENQDNCSSIPGLSTAKGDPVH